MRFLRPHRFMELDTGGAGAGGAGGATPPPPPAGGGSGAPSPQPHGIAWLPVDADAELVGHVQNKGWKSAADAASAHRAAERLIGADRAGRTVTLPTDENDQAGWQAVYEKLGRPATAGDYKLPVPEGADPSFATAAAEQFHKLGIPLKAAQQLTAWWNEKAGAMTAAQTAAQQAAIEADVAVLDKDWGTEKAARIEVAKRGAQALGLDADAIEALQRSAGGSYTKTMKALAKVGDMVKESKVDGLDSPGSFSMTPEGAKAKKSQLMADQDWGKRASKNGSPEWNELTRLNRIISEAQP
jgi:hypothetical protein